MGSYANPVSLGLFAGATVPLGDLADDYATTGWHIGGLLQWNSPSAPFAFRGDVAYHDFGIDNDLADEQAPSMVVGTLNALWLFPTMSAVRPYVIGGAGVYNERCSICQSQTKLGLNGGLGITVPLSGVTTMIEARFHMILDSQDAVGNTPAFSNSTFIPISVGILFR